MDTISSEARSALMSRIRSVGNLSTEKVLRSALMRSGIRGWRLHAKELPGIPDFIFKKQKLAVFVDGCFWHGCPKCYRRPHSNNLYWDAKIERNLRRDKQVNLELRKSRWSILRIWEHELNNPRKIINRVLKKLSGLQHNK